MSRIVIIGLIVIFVGIAAGWFVLRDVSQEVVNLLSPGRTSTPTPYVEVTMTPSPTLEPLLSVTPGAAGEKGGIPTDQSKMQVSYTDTGFTSATVTVKKGTTVVFTNNSAKGMWVASDMHPTHQLLPGFDQLKSVNRGGIYEYTFTQVGTWRYHNHVAPTDTATVVVTQ